MNYANIAKKNKDKEQFKIVKEKKENIEKVFNPYSELNFKNEDDEFEYKYLEKMTDISIEFRDFISKNYLPFMDKIINVNYHIYDYIKDHSYEYKKVAEHVKNYNEDLIIEYDKEMEELQKELEDEENFSD